MAREVSADDLEAGVRSRHPQAERVRHRVVHRVHIGVADRRAHVLDLPECVGFRYKGLRSRAAGLGLVA